MKFELYINQWISRFQMFLAIKVQSTPCNAHCSTAYVANAPKHSTE